MTVEELHKKYGFKFDKKAKIRYLEGQSINPVHMKHAAASFIIQTIWGHVHNENMSTGKARELTSAVIEEHLENLSN